MNIDQLGRHFGRTFGPRNHILLPDPASRANHLQIVIGSLHDAERKDRGIEEVRLQLARSVAAFFVLANHFYAEDFPFWKALSIKFPAYGCGYCGEMPCGCRPDRRLPHRPKEIDPKQKRWTLRRWQKHFAAVYGPNNRKLGIQNATNRLFKEVVEVLTLVMRDRPRTTEEFIREYLLEAADIFSWICGIAFLYDLDLEHAVMERYGDGCAVCKKKPCECLLFHMSESRMHIGGCATV